ncbi:hypothetical protein Adt_05627 [Abeliophyllum distichum]|uniref:Uncharacterized protein n=1 Tax=Abeliophyllum distichum TaxID=126358 RepID=A0ABD1V4L8_9LAMI
MATADWEDENEWELTNDDGFVYKRKKRLRLDPSTARQPPDQAAEKKYRRERKKSALLKLREKYLNEFRQWELLSNMLKEMQLNDQTQQQKQPELLPTTLSERPTCSNELPMQSKSDFTRRLLVDELFSQVEAQEAIIRDVSNLCDVAKALCSAQEEKSKQQFTELPIWESSPDMLMAALVQQ